jgi:hypothetical protein
MSAALRSSISLHLALSAASPAVSCLSPKCAASAPASTALTTAAAALSAFTHRSRRSGSASPASPSTSCRASTSLPPGPGGINTAARTRRAAPACCVRADMLACCAGAGGRWERAERRCACAGADRSSGRWSGCAAASSVASASKAGSFLSSQSFLRNLTRASRTSSASRSLSVLPSSALSFLSSSLSSSLGTTTDTAHLSSPPTFSTPVSRSPGFAPGALSVGAVTKSVCRAPFAIGAPVYLRQRAAARSTHRPRGAARARTDSLQTLGAVVGRALVAGCERSLQRWVHARRQLLLLEGRDVSG